MTGSGCPAPEELSGYASLALGNAPGRGDHLVANVARARMEAHAAECARCRRQLAALGATAEPETADEAAAIERLATKDFSALTAAGIPAPDVLDLARHVVLGRIALAEGQLPAARSAFEQAVATQERLTYSEPPYWYYPVGQSLAAVLLRLGELDAAEDAFRASLARAPNNGWALYGLSEVYRRMGRPDAAAEVTRRFDEAWAGDRNALELGRL